MCKHESKSQLAESQMYKKLNILRRMNVETCSLMRSASLVHASQKEGQAFAKEQLRSSLAKLLRAIHDGREGREEGCKK